MTLPLQGPQVLWRLASAAVCAVAGLSLFVLLWNRLVSSLRDSPGKHRLVRFLLLTLTLGSAFFGYVAGPSKAMLVPLAWLGALALGEIGRLHVRRRHRGAPPVERLHVPISLARPITTTDLSVLRYELALPGWRGPSFRILHVSDFHVNDQLPETYYRAVVDRINDLRPDLIFLTGDFVTDAQFVPLLPSVLGGMRSRFGAFAVLGNHDHWADPDGIAAALRVAGIHLLGHASRRVRVSKNSAVLIGGLEQPWRKEAWQAPSPAAGEPVFILTHTADHIYRLSRAGVDAVFAGHFHGGQMRVPCLGALVVPSIYGRRFDHGHFLVHGTHLFVTAGIGVHYPPLRIYCQPDMIVVDIVVGGHGC